VPGEIEDLFLYANLKKSTIKPECITKYLNYKNEIQNGRFDSGILTKEKDSFLVEDLEVCLENEVPHEP
jgi:hypothetical protein